MGHLLPRTTALWKRPQGPPHLRQLEELSNLKSRTRTKCPL